MFSWLFEHTEVRGVSLFAVLLLLLGTVAILTTAALFYLVPIVPTSILTGWAIYKLWESHW